MKKPVVLVIAVLTVLGGRFAAADSWTLSGTFKNSTVEDGTPVFIRLIDAGARCLDPRQAHYSTSATLADGKAEYTLEGVAEGEYTACAFFDLVAEEGPGRPESGDLGAVKSVTIKRDSRLDFGEDAWMPLP